MNNQDGRISPKVVPEGRLPYEAPAIEETSQFETLALACGQSDTNLSCIGLGEPYFNS